MFPVYIWKGPMQARFLLNVLQIHYSNRHIERHFTFNSYTDELNVYTPSGLVKVPVNTSFSLDSAGNCYIHS